MVVKIDDTYYSIPLRQFDTRWLFFWLRRVSLDMTSYYFVVVNQSFLHDHDRQLTPCVPHRAESAARCAENC